MKPNILIRTVVSFGFTYSLYAFGIDVISGIIFYLFFLWIWLTILSFSSKSTQITSSINRRSLQIIRTSSILSFIILVLVFVSLFSFGGRMLIGAFGLYFLTVTIIPCIALISLIIFSIDLEDRIQLLHIDNTSLNKYLSLFFLPYGIWLITVKKETPSSF